MNKVQYSFRNMCGGIVLLRNGTPVATLGRMAHWNDYYVPFTANLGIIDAKWEFQRRNTKGFRERKVAMRGALEVTTLDNSARLGSYATFVGNQVLLTMITFTESELVRMPDTEIVVVAMLIKDKMTEFVDDLLPYGITLAVIDAYNTQIEKYVVVNSEPRFEIDMKKDSTVDLGAVIKDTKVLLKNMDKEVLTLKVSDRGFYNSYKTVRGLVEPSTHTMVARGSVKDRDGNPLLVHMTCRDLDIDRKLKKGTFFINHAVDGVYELTFVRAGYVKQIYLLTVVNGERAEIEIVMVPE